MRMLLFFCVLMCACAGQHCFQFEGEYSGINGSVQYCYDAASSKENNVPTFVGENQKSFLLSEKQAQVLLDRIQVKDSNVKVLELKESAIKKLIRISEGK